MRLSGGKQSISHVVTMQTQQASVIRTAVLIISSQAYSNPPPNQTKRTMILLEVSVKQRDQAKDQSHSVIIQDVLTDRFEK